MEQCPNFSAVIQEFKRGYELMGKLQFLLEFGSSSGAHKELIFSLGDEALQTCSTALSKLKSNNYFMYENISSSQRSILPSAKGVPANDKNGDSKVTAAPYHDGYLWRKYGEKKILGSSYPRCYYRCTYKEQGCRASKQVQLHNNIDDRSLYLVTYKNKHTCNTKTINNSYKIPPQFATKMFSFGFDSNNMEASQVSPNYEKQVNLGSSSGTSSKYNEGSPSFTSEDNKVGIKEMVQLMNEDDPFTSDAMPMYMPELELDCMEGDFEYELWRYS